MKQDNKIKRLTGEKNAKRLLLHFSSDFLDENLPKIFAIPKEIRNIDFEKEDNINKLNILFADFYENKKEVEKPKKTAKELLDEKGYILDDKIKEYKDYLKYKKYYKEDELLCKFNDSNRCNSSRIFWIIKKDIDKIIREDFVGKEKRQDEYGTSCCSISITKDGKNISQICNRYNHKVPAPDNTFNSNLDNIAQGLTEAFNNDYGFNLGKSSIVEFENFFFKNGKYWHYNREINGIKYGENSVDGVYYDPERFLIFDNFILDIKNREIRCGGNEIDGLVEIINDKLKKGARVIITKKEINDNDNDIIFIKQ